MTIALDLFVVDTDGVTLIPFQPSAAPPPPPPPPFDVYANSVLLDLDLFGITIPGGVPYNDTAGVITAEQATFDMNGTVPFLTGA